MRWQLSVELPGANIRETVGTMHLIITLVAPRTTSGVPIVDTESLGKDMLYVSI